MNGSSKRQSGSNSVTANPSSWKDIFLNVDLHALTPVYLDLLDSWRHLYDAVAVLPSDVNLVEHVVTNRLSRIVYRYERLWLPLVADWKTSPDPEPPVDVHWIWHVHQLRAQPYADYCRKQFGRIIAHRLRPPRGQEAARSTQQTVDAWRHRYPGEPFDLPPAAVDDDDRVATKSRCTLTELLVDAVRQEVDFVYQVALPHMRDANFLYTAVERYRKMLLLRRQRPIDASEVRVPVDVQLIQRVHALHPVQYVDDFRRLFGVVGPATATVPDCKPNCEAHLAQIEKSDAIWRTTFRGEKLFISGASYRGRVVPQGSIMRRFPRETFASRTAESCDITFTSVTVDEMWSHSGIKRVVVEARLLGENSFDQELIFRQSGTVGVAIGAAPGEGGGGGPTQSLGTTHFDVHRNRGIELVVDGRQGIGCFARRRNLSTKLFNPLQHCNQAAVSHTVSLPKVTYTDPKITISFSVQAATPKPHVFTFDRNQPTTQPVAPNLRPFIGPQKVWASVMGSPDSLFLHARHALKCRDSGLAFGVEIIKQEQSNLSAVLIYHNNQNLVAAAYSINEDQLPDPCQVSETCPLALDTHEDDYAMLVRNHQGDYAVCVARRRQIAIADGGGTAADAENTIGFCVYFVGSRQTCKFDVRDDEMQTIKLSSTEGSFAVDLPTGRMTIDACVEPLAEYIALAFTVGILFVAIQKTSFQLEPADSYPTGSIRSTLSTPRRGSPVPSETSGRSGTSRNLAKARQQKKKAATKRRKMSASFTFLLACGLQVDLALYGTLSDGDRASIASRGHSKSALNGNVRGGYPQFADDRGMLDVRL